MTGPTVEDVIAEAVGRAMVLRTSPHEIAAAVVAAIRGMTVEQLVDLRLDLTIERYGSPGWQRSRVVGLWRVEP